MFEVMLISLCVYCIIIQEALCYVKYFTSGERKFIAIANISHMTTRIFIVSMDIWFKQTNHDYDQCVQGPFVA